MSLGMRIVCMYECVCISVSEVATNSPFGNETLSTLCAQNSKIEFSACVGVADALFAGTLVA